MFYCSQNAIIESIRNGQNFSGPHFFNFMSSPANEHEQEMPIECDKQAEYIIGQLRLGSALSGAAYVVLCEYLGQALSYSAKKHLILEQKAVSYYMRESILNMALQSVTHLSYSLKSTLESMYLNKSVTLVYMNDARPVPLGTVGLVDHIDDAGQLHIHWENGSRLAVVFDAGDVIALKE